MKYYLVISAAAMCGCVTTPSEPVAASQDVGFSFGRSLSQGRILLNISITNQSAAAICVRTEAVRNRYSYEMILKMRDAAGRNVSYHKPGFLAPPQEGITRIEPGATIQASYYLDSRFKLKDSARLPEGMQVHAEFAYDHCEGHAVSLRAASGWQAI